MANATPFPFGLFAEITREVVDRRGAEGADILYAAGLAFGEAVIDALRTEGIAASALFATALERASRWGFGAVAARGDGAVPGEVVIDTPAAASWNPLPDGQPACHLFRGILAGFAQRALRRPVDVVETACAAAGGTACAFRLSSNVLSPSEDSWSW